MKRLFKQTQGSAAIEFALVAPTMLFLMTMIIEICQGYMVRNDLQYALNEAARYVMLNTTASGSMIEEQVANRVSTISEDDIEVTIEDVVVNDQDFKHIRLAYSFDTITGDMLHQDTVLIRVETTIPALP